MKLLSQIALLFCTFVMMLSVAFADGDPNIDGDVGGGNYWNVGDDGVRVSIVRDNLYGIETLRTIDILISQ